MCGRYHIDGSMEEGIRTLIARIERQLQEAVEAGRGEMAPVGRPPEGKALESGGPQSRTVEPVLRRDIWSGSRDIFPASEAPILRIKGRAAQVEPCIWGFPGFEGGKLLINARSETALEKERFRDSVLERRCLILASGFYEWSEKKEKYYFSLPGENRPLFLAGFYKSFAGEERFIILTRQADASVRRVHSRMPLILEEEAAAEWLQNDAAVSGLLKAAAPPLIREKEGQLSLFD